MVTLASALLRHLVAVKKGFRLLLKLLSHELKLSGVILTLLVLELLSADAYSPLTRSSFPLPWPSQVSPCPARRKWPGSNPTGSQRKGVLLLEPKFAAGVLRERTDFWSDSHLYSPRDIGGPAQSLAGGGQVKLPLCHPT